MKKSINGKRRRSNKNILIFIVVFIFVIYISVLLTVSNRKYLFLESAFKNASAKINEFFIDKVYSTKNYSNKMINSKIKYLQDENNDLRKALDFKKRNENYLIAEVVNHTSKTWFNKVSINKGYNSNIKKDSLVVNENGLVGFIGKVSKNQSEVKLITSVSDDNMLSVFVEAQGEAASGMLSYYDNKSDLFKVESITSKAEIKKGDCVVLSGFDNPLYKGIYVGAVVKEETDDYGLSRTVWVKSDVNFNDLMFLGVYLTEG